MRNALAFVALAACGSSPVVSGKIKLLGAADSKNVPVTLVSASNSTKSWLTFTAADGSYSFKDGIDKGNYELHATVADSREGTASVGVVVAAAATSVGEIDFTVVANVSGSATIAGAKDNSGITVNVLGTGASAATDAAGNYQMTGVPLGAQVIAGSTDGAVSATAPITVARGANTAPALVLNSVPPPPTATVSGRTLFAGNQSPAIIAISAGSVTTTPAADGTWSLSVPPGSYPILADAPNYPELNLGIVTVVSGQTLDIGSSMMSFYHVVRTGPLQLQPYPSPTAPYASATGLWVAMEEQIYSGGGNNLGNYYLVDAKSGASRLIFASADSSPGLGLFSASGRWLALATGNALWIYDTTTGSVRVASAVSFSTSSFFFTKDEAALVVLGTSGMAIVNLATLATADYSGAATLPFPVNGSHPLIDGTRNFFSAGADLYLTTYDSATPAIVVAHPVTDAFAANPRFFSHPDGTAVLVLHNCTSTCDVLIITPDGNTIDNVSTVSNGSNYNNCATVTPADAPWIPCDTGASEAIIRSNGDVATGPAVAIPADMVFNDSGTRVAYPAGGSDSCVEAIDKGTVLGCAGSNIISHTAGFVGNWMSDTRYAGDDGTSIYIKDGEAAAATTPQPGPAPSLGRNYMTWPTSAALTNFKAISQDIGPVDVPPLVGGTTSLDYSRSPDGNFASLTYAYLATTSVLFDLQFDNSKAGAPIVITDESSVNTAPKQGDRSVGLQDLPIASGSSPSIDHFVLNDSTHQDIALFEPGITLVSTPTAAQPYGTFAAGDNTVVYAIRADPAGTATLTALQP